MGFLCEVGVRVDGEQSSCSSRLPGTYSNHYLIRIIMLLLLLLELLLVITRTESNV